MDDARPFSATTLYDTDFVAWTERQSALLLARQTSELDYELLAEEVGDLGESELHACTSQVVNILLRLTKIEFVGPSKQFGTGAERSSGSETRLNEGSRPRCNATCSKSLKTSAARRVAD